MPPSVRTPWTQYFPKVVVHTELQRRDGHPCYSAAKAGDVGAASQLAFELASPEAVAELHALVGELRPILLPVVADEAEGFNAIPDALARTLSEALNLPVDAGNIVQVNKVGHTRAPAFQRIVTPAEFDGRVESGRTYLLVDDHVGLGGTLANLRGFLHANGSSVIGMTTLTESREARQIALTPATLTMLRATHGNELENLWLRQFGHGLDCLTEIEGRQLCRQKSVATIEDFLAQAAVEVGQRGLTSVFAEAASGEGGRSG